MKYIIMCGGTYIKWKKPRQLTEIKGEPIVARTIRLLKENNIKDIYISSNNPAFDGLGVPRLQFDNFYRSNGEDTLNGSWLNAFYLTDEPVCYLYGDVVYSENAIKTIVETETEGIKFFGSMSPFSEKYTKPWIEPFAFKVVNQKHFHWAIEKCKEYDRAGCFVRSPISWELWSVICHTPLNVTYNNYTPINDYTCDIDKPEDAKLIEEQMD